METTRLRITGMVCDACAGHVKTALEAVPEVRAARVDRTARQATVEHADAPTAALVAAVADAGYQAEVEAGDES